MNKSGFQGPCVQRGLGWHSAGEDPRPQACSATSSGASVSSSMKWASGHCGVQVSEELLGLYLETSLPGVCRPSQGRDIRGPLACPGLSCLYALCLWTLLSSLPGSSRPSFTEARASASGSLPCPPFLLPDMTQAPSIFR